MGSNDVLWLVLHCYSLNIRLHFVEVASAMSMVMMARYMGYLVGVASCSAIVQGTLKLLLSERLSGPDAAEVKSKQLAFFEPYTWLTNHSMCIAGWIYSHIDWQSIILTSWDSRNGCSSTSYIFGTSWMGCCCCNCNSYLDCHPNEGCKQQKVIGLSIVIAIKLYDAPTWWIWNVCLFFSIFVPTAIIYIYIYAHVTWKCCYHG